MSSILCSMDELCRLNPEVRRRRHRIKQLILSAVGTMLMVGGLMDFTDHLYQFGAWVFTLAWIWEDAI